jgi:TolA-binding protein
MKFRAPSVPILVFLLVLLLAPDARPAQREADRLWLIGSQAFADQLYSLARRVLEQLVQRYPQDARLPEATLLLGKARLAFGELPQALESFRQAQRFTPQPGRPEEARFWEGETLFRLKRYQEARAVYDALLATNAASPLAPDALYAYAWCELELKRPEPAVTAFRQLLEAWPEHPLAPSATYHLARTLIELKRTEDAGALLALFASRYPGHRLLPEARYLLGWSRLAAGKPDEGIADLRAFIADHPTHELVPQAWREITGAVLRHGRTPDMVEEYRFLMSQSSPTAGGLYDAGLIAQTLGRQKDAEAAWTKLRSTFPDHVLARRAALQMAHAAFRRNQFREAVALAQEASRSEEGAVRMEALLLVGESEIRSKRFQAALVAFDAALGLDSRDRALRFRALAGSGLAHEELRHWREAAERYEKVAVESPDQTLKQWAKARLAAVRAKLNSGPKPKAKTPNS